MTYKTLVLLGLAAMVALLPGCDSSHQEEASSQQQQSEATTTNSVGRCADKGSTDGQSQEEVGRGDVSNGKIVFVRRIASGTDIYVIDVEGTHETRLTRTVPYEALPGWSPDGEKIAFVRAGVELYVINADGSGLRSLGAPWEGGGLGSPVWSPDGQNIAFVTITTSSELYVINADKTKRTIFSPLTKSRANHSEYEIDLGTPAWSPTGNRIAFARYTRPPSDASASSAPVKELSGIYLINSDGTGLCKLISTRTQLSDPLWSPDGEKIAFYDTFYGNGAIYVINSDGSGRKKLTGGTYDPPQHAWSPDGEKIAFFCPGDEGTDLCVINADGGEWTRLVLKVDAAMYNQFASWGSG